MLSFQKILNSVVNVAQDKLDDSMLQSVDFSLCLEVVRENKWSVLFLHFGQSLFAQYFAVLLGANDMGERDMVESVENVSTFRATFSLIFFSVDMKTRNRKSDN